MSSARPRTQQEPKGERAPLGEGAARSVPADGPGGWLSRDRAELATERILDAAAELFTHKGVSATTMTEVATQAGCSRATLYNHFADRRELEVAFVHREAIALSRRVATSTAGIADPAQRIRAAFSTTLDGVRTDDRLRRWFSTGEVGLATAISANSEVLDAISAAFAGSLGAKVDPEELRRRARWVLRMVLSLLAMPESDPTEEEAIVERFVVAPLLEPAARSAATTLR